MKVPPPTLEKIIIVILIIIILVVSFFSSFLQDSSHKGKKYIREEALIIVMDINTRECLMVSPANNTLAVEGDRENNIIEVGVYVDENNGLAFFFNKSDPITPLPMYKDVVVYKGLVFMFKKMRKRSVLKITFKERISGDSRESSDDQIQRIQNSISYFVSGVCFSDISSMPSGNRSGLRNTTPNSYKLSIVKDQGQDVVSLVRYRGNSCIEENLDSEIRYPFGVWYTGSDLKMRFMFELFL